MDDNKVGREIIVSAEDREKPIGIFTESDVVRNHRQNKYLGYLKSP